MKLLHTSDWHLGKSLYEFSLLDDARRMLDFLLDLIVRERIDAVVIAGDIYDRPIPSAEAVRLYDSFLTKAVAELHVPVLAIAGNHDSASRLEFGSKLYAGGGYHVFGTAKPSEPPVILQDDFGEVRFYAIPWLHPAEMRAMYEDSAKESGTVIKTFDDAYRVFLADMGKRLDKNVRNVAIAHGFFAGIASHAEKEILVSDSELHIGGMDIADSGCFADFDYTALGHLHAPQRAGAEHIRYSGSPLKYSLSEERQRKSCAIVELKAKGAREITLIDIPATHDVRSINGTFDELMEPTYHTNTAFDDYVFANITDSGALYPMEKLRTLFPNLLGLRFVTEAEAFSPPDLRSQTEQKLSVLELFERFYKDAKGTDMPEEGLAFLREVIGKNTVDL